MQILDCITPPSSTDPRELSRIAQRHLPVLEALRQQRAPTESRLPPPADITPYAERVADEEFVAALRAACDAMATEGFTLPHHLVLVASAAPGYAAEVIPSPSGSMVAVFVDRAEGREVAALLGAIAVLHRWSDPALGNPIAELASRWRWNKWEVARKVPLAEWIYAAGIGMHAAGSGTGTHYARLRAQEPTLQARLDADLDEVGIGLLVRWLEDDAPPAMRRCADGFVVPPGAGRYLGWRMTAERVARVGVLEASRMRAT